MELSGQIRRWIETAVRFVGYLLGKSQSRYLDVIDLDERLAHMRSISVIGGVAGIIFAIFNIFLEDMLPLGLVELAASVFFFFPAYLLSSKPEHVELTQKLVLMATLAFPCGLVVYGGVEGTGLFWVYVVPFTLFFLLGQRKGWQFSLGFMAVLTACFAWVAPHVPQRYPFTDVTFGHFLMSLVFYTVVAAAFNHARMRFEHQLRLGKLAAEEADQAKSRFLAAASHDLRQPAHALGLFVARLNQLETQPQTRPLVAGVDASVRALQEMLDAFFDYTRLDGQLMQVHRRAVSLDDIFTKLRTSFTPIAEEKGLRLRIRPTRVWVESDPVLLHRILLNLIGNALQHTEFGSVLVACRVQTNTGGVRIEVRDSGIGIRKEHHERIFEEFFQVGNRARDRSKGLGLGLSIVERSCKLLNHRISLQSDLGCGARFCLELSRATPVDNHLANVGSEPQSTGGLHGLRVLLIEDDPLGGVALLDLLQSWGCKVALAESAQRALELQKISAPPDYIVSDFRLPGQCNGVQAIQQLRDYWQTDLPACVISGDTDEGVRTLVRESGHTLLQKPVRPAKLRSVLRHTFLTISHKNGESS